MTEGMHFYFKPPTRWQQFKKFIKHPVHWWRARHFRRAEKEYARQATAQFKEAIEKDVLEQLRGEQ